MITVISIVSGYAMPDNNIYELSKGTAGILEQAHNGKARLIIGNMDIAPIKRNPIK